MPKVRFFDKRVAKIFLQITSVVSGAVSLGVIFFDIPPVAKIKCCLQCTLKAWTKNVHQTLSRSAG